MLGSEPDEDEAPPELDDFPSIIQQVFTVYGMLSDIWDPMGGNYLGKDYGILFNLFNLYSITEREEQLLAAEFIKYIDSVRSNIIYEKQKASKPAS